VVPDTLLRTVDGLYSGMVSLLAAVAAGAVVVAAGAVVVAAGAVVVAAGAVVVAAGAVVVAAGAVVELDELHPAIPHVTRSISKISGRRHGMPMALPGARRAAMCGGRGISAWCCPVGAETSAGGCSVVMFFLHVGHWGGVISEGVLEPVVDGLGPDLLAQTAAMAVSPLMLSELDEM